VPLWVLLQPLTGETELDIKLKYLALKYIKSFIFSQSNKFVRFYAKLIMYFKPPKPPDMNKSRWFGQATYIQLHLAVDE
jgi:hypothetical protein